MLFEGRNRKNIGGKTIKYRKKKCGKPFIYKNHKKLSRNLIQYVILKGKVYTAK